MHYKAPDNTVYWIEPEFEHMLPTGCVAITDEEAKELLPKPNMPTYATFRAEEYPPITDYLDGVVKGDQTQIDKYIADCLAVKAKYPKE